MKPRGNPFLALLVLSFVASIFTSLGWSAESVTVFGFSKVQIDQAKVKLFSMGRLQVRGTRAPICGFKGHFISPMNKGEAVVWVLDENLQGWRGTIDKDVPLWAEVKFDRATELDIYIAPNANSDFTEVFQGELVLADGSNQSLLEVVSAGLEAGLAEQRSHAEPATVALDAAASRRLVQRDWLRQKWDQDWPQACADQLRRLDRILNRMHDRAPAAANGKKGTELVRLAAAAKLKADRELYFQIRDFKRRLLLQSPDIDFDQILCVDKGYVPYGHEVRYRNSDMVPLGARLLLLSGLGPDAVPRKLAPTDEPAALCRPDLRFDAAEIAFSMKKQSDRAYHLYTINLDGTELKRLTCSDYDDLDPLYLPDGNFAFNTTRSNQFLRCAGSDFRMPVLARCDRDGQNIYLISANIEADYSPTLTSDGQLLYCRWEYVDKEFGRVQSLWTINPDGTGLSAYWGNQSRWPDMLSFPRMIPGTSNVVFASTAHHNMYRGALGVIKPHEGFNYPDGVYNLSPHIPWPEAGPGPKDRPFNPEFSVPTCYESFWTPYPISADLMLVSARACPGRYEEKGYNNNNFACFSLYLMDFDGNMELLYQGHRNIVYAVPVRPRVKPHVIPFMTVWPGRKRSADHQPKPGLLYSGDVYQGSGIPRGLADRLRILEIEPKCYGDGNWSRSARNLVPNVGIRAYLLNGSKTSLVYDDSPKLILGTVPVEEDGSVYFEAPPGRALYFQLLDKNGRCLQTMRSSTHVMPGERRGCIGCHETRAVAPEVKPALALQRPPSVIEPPLWGEESVSFNRFVQPVLNTHCVGCHNTDKPSDGYDFMERKLEGTPFTAPYVALVFGKTGSERKPGREGSVAGPIFPYEVYSSNVFEFSTQDTVVPPMTAMSYKSPLMSIVSSGQHHGVKVSAEEEARIGAWIDALCPMLGREDILSIPNDPVDPTKTRHTYSARLSTHPQVFKAFCQDEFTTQDDRIAKDENGKELPAFELKDGKRHYNLPKRN